MPVGPYGGVYKWRNGKKVYQKRRRNRQPPPPRPEKYAHFHQFSQLPPEIKEHVAKTLKSFGAHREK